MSYSKEYTKTKIKNNLSVILVTIIVSLSSLLITLNIINSYLLNISYDVERAHEIENMISNIEVLSERILNNQGRFSDEDYKKIVERINSAREILNNEKTKEYLFKEKYTMKDYYDFEEYLNEEMYQFLVISRQNNEYRILLKYDANIVDDLLSYDRHSSFLDSSEVHIQEHINNSYSYNINFDNVNMPMTFLHVLYLREHSLLNDIIEVGEISE